MKISVFLSRPTPHLERQQQFIERVSSYLDSRGFVGRTLGITDYDIDAPLKAIRRLMLECNGLITVALARTHIEKGRGNYLADLSTLKERAIEDAYLTSPWAHIEAAKAYQIGLPVLVFREAKVVADGVLEKGVIGTYMPAVHLDRPFDYYFNSGEWLELIGKWEGYVRAVVDNKGTPPRPY
jgi:hypothetical protein